MRKFSRSKILGIVTAGAMVVTTAFSFAAWDALTANTNADLSVRNPVVITADAPSAFGTTSAINENDAPVYTTDVTFNLANPVDNLTFTPTVVVKDDKAATIDPAKYDVSYEFGGTPGTSKPVGKADASVACKVKITPKDVALAGQTLKVEITGTLTQ